jgi:VWFA-related protein
MTAQRTAVALLLAAATVFAQQPAQLPTFSESIEVRVLNLDVDVTDAAGNPVTDLKKDDFTVKIGGKPVPIDYFALISEGALHAPDLATAPPERVLSTYKQAEESAYVPRNFLIYVDVGYLPPGLRNRALNAIRDLTSRLGPNDAVRVVLFDRAPRVLVDWTTSKELVMAELAGMEKETVGMSRLQTQEQTIAMINGFSGSRRTLSSRQQLAQQYGQEVGAEIQNMIDSIQNELVTLTPLNGKRAFLFVSGGYEYQPGYVMAQYATGSFLPSMSNIDVRQVPARINAMIQKANEVQVTFYTVDATGLTGEGTPASDGSPSTNVLAIEQRPSLRFAAQQDRQTPLQMMAVDTGGLALLNTNDFQQGLSRIYRQVSNYYTLGITLSKLGITGYQKVDVAVNRTGLTVRSRKGWAPMSEPQTIETRALATMETDLSYNAIPAKIEVAPATPDKKLYLLPITVLVPADSLTFLPQGDKEAARAEFYIGSVDEKGNRSPLNRQETTFEIPSGKAKAGTFVRYAAQLQTKKGNYRIVVNVRDAQSGKMGTARANVHVE